MINYQEAIHIIDQFIDPLPSVRLPVYEAAGKVLAEIVTSAEPIPSFTKSLMDGYAIQSAAISAGITRFRLLGTVYAGDLPLPVLECPSDAAIRVMTGAALSFPFDTVVPQENVSEDGLFIHLQNPVILPGQFVMPTGGLISPGDQLFLPGTVITPVVMGVLLDVGITSVNIIPKPTVYLFSTGDELVPPESIPRPGQIRNSTQGMLLSLLQALDVSTTSGGILPDEQHMIQDHLRSALEHFDLVIITGGMSVGIKDFIPRIVQDLKLELGFHGVRIKPGKPILFAKYCRSSRPSYVFGLPGNPVSTLVGFHLFVKTAIMKLSGHAQLSNPIKAKLSMPFDYKTDRETFYPCKLNWLGTVLTAEPLPWKGSSDLRTCTQANGMILLSAQPTRYACGEEVLAWWW